MTGAEFKAWRAALGLSQAAAGAQLGRTERQVRNIEQGAAVDPALALACAALAAGLEAWRPIAENVKLPPAPLSADLLRVLALAARPEGFRDHRRPSAGRTAELERLGLIRFVAGMALATERGRAVLAGADPGSGE